MLEFFVLRKDQVTLSVERFPLGGQPRQEVRVASTGRTANQTVMEFVKAYSACPGDVKKDRGKGANWVVNAKKGHRVGREGDRVANAAVGRNWKLHRMPRQRVRFESLHALYHQTLHGSTHPPR